MKTGITILLLFLAPLMYAAPCGIHGSADPESREYALNPFKNRSKAPHTVNPRTSHWNDSRTATDLMTTKPPQPAIAAQRTQRTKIRTSRW